MIFLKKISNPYSGVIVKNKLSEKVTFKVQNKIESIEPDKMLQVFLDLEKEKLIRVK